MRSVLVVLALITLVAAPIAYGQILKAVIKGGETEPNLRGVVTFTKLNASFTEVKVEIEGITENPNGTHGLHIHQYGDIRNSSTLGSHWAAAGQTHACPTPESNEYSAANRHFGDMGNWLATNGVINETKVIDHISFEDDSLVGRSVAMHQTEDSCQDPPNAGSIIAYGVIGLTNETGTLASANYSVDAATCLLTPTETVGNNSATGIFYFAQVNGTVEIYGWIEGLVNNSVHGLHIHALGDITNVNSTTTGAHWDKTGSNHRLPPTLPRHSGDLGLVGSYDATNGVAYYYYNVSTDIFTITEIIGRALVLHSNPDDGCTNPAGNSGARIAHCTIGAAGSYLPASEVIPATVTIINQPGSNCDTPSDLPYEFTPPPTASPSSGATVVVSFALAAIVLLVALLF